MIVCFLIHLFSSALDSRCCFAFSIFCFSVLLSATDFDRCRSDASPAFDNDAIDEAVLSGTVPVCWLLARLMLWLTSSWWLLDDIDSLRSRSVAIEAIGIL